MHSEKGTIDNIIKKLLIDQFNCKTLEAFFAIEKEKKIFGN